MGIVFRQSAKTAAIYMAGVALGALTLIAGPLIMPKQEFGFSRNLINQGGLLHFLALLGFNHTIATFIPRYKPQDPRRKVLFTVGLLAPVVITLLISPVYFILRDDILILLTSRAQDAVLMKRFYYLLPPLILFWGFGTNLEAFLFVHKRVALAAFWREAFIKAGNLALMLLIWAGAIHYSGFLWGSVFFYGMAALALLYVSSKQEGFGLLFKRRVLSLKEWRETLHFSWYHLLTGSALTLMDMLPLLMLPALSIGGMDDIAVMGPASFIATVLAIPYRAIGTSSFPILNEAYIRKDMAKVSEIFVRSANTILIGGMALFAVMAPNLRHLVGLLPAGYEALAPLALLLMSGRVIDMLTGMNSELIGISPHYPFIFRLALVMVVVLFLLCYLLIPAYGMWGAAFAAAGAMTLFNISKTIFVWLRFHVHPFSKNAACIIFAGLAGAAAGGWLPKTGLGFITDATITTLISAGVYLAILLWLKPSDDLRMIPQAITNFRKKLRGGK